MKRMHVEQQQIWTFYGDNCPVGVGLRKHPNDHYATLNETILPMQQVYCDARVVQDDTGVVFYRVQGTKNWIFDRRVDKATKKITDTMLLPPSKVTKGLFAYRSLSGIDIRTEPTTNDETRSSCSIKKGELCIADTIRQGKGGNGPYVDVRVAHGRSK